MKNDDSPSAISTKGLGKRFGDTWALEECAIEVPRGRVTALVGPNGAGKTTLLRLLVGLAVPSAGDARVLGRRPEQSEDYLASIGYLAQDVPLYRRLSADDHLRLGARLNRHWDDVGARERLKRLGVPIDRPVATLSGGQRAQVGLGMALAKQPQILLLDEPVAALDPLARLEFLASLTEAVAGGDLSVVLSSHLLHDLERVCDHVVLLASGHAQLCEEIDAIVASHRMLVGPKRPLVGVESSIKVVKSTVTTNQLRLVAKVEEPILDPTWEVSELGLEDIIVAYMAHDDFRTSSLSPMEELAS